jgi:putative FmdB family regulatory protein
VPIYEYYCPACDGRFSHLARKIAEPPPPCPGCGSHQVEKLISQAHLGRSETQRQATLEARSREVNRDDPQAIARFLQQAGDVADEMGPVQRDAFQEIVARRAEGAGDEDLQDVVDAIPFPRQSFERAGDGEHAHHDHEAHGCECGHEHSHDEAHERGPTKNRSRRGARDLGWA